MLNALENWYVCSYLINKSHSHTLGLISIADWGKLSLLWINPEWMMAIEFGPRFSQNSISAPSLPSRYSEEDFATHINSCVRTWQKVTLTVSCVLKYIHCHTGGGCILVNYHTYSHWDSLKEVLMHIKSKWLAFKSHVLTAAAEEELRQSTLHFFARW